MFGHQELKPCELWRVFRCRNFMSSEGCLGNVTNRMIEVLKSDVKKNGMSVKDLIVSCNFEKLLLGGLLLGVVSARWFNRQELQEMAVKYDHNAKHLTGCESWDDLERTILAENVFPSGVDAALSWVDSLQCGEVMKTRMKERLAWAVAQAGLKSEDNGRLQSYHWRSSDQ